MSLSLTACTDDPFSQISPSSSNSSDYSYETESTYNSDQAISYKASVTMESKDFDKDSKDITKLIKDKGGVVLNQANGSTVSQQTDYLGRQLTMDVDIPKDHYQEVTQTLQDTYEVSYFSQESQDLSQDMSEGQDQLQTLKDRLAEVEEELKDKDLSTTEKGALRQEKYSLEDQIKDYQSQQTDRTDSVDYSRISLTLNEVDLYAREGQPAWVPFKRAFSYFFSVLAYSLMIAIVIAIVITPILFVLSLAYLLIRKYQFKMFKKLEAKMASKDGSRVKRKLSAHKTTPKDKDLN